MLRNIQTTTNLVQNVDQQIVTGGMDLRGDLRPGSLLHPRRFEPWAYATAASLSPDKARPCSARFARSRSRIAA